LPKKVQPEEEEVKLVPVAEEKPKLPAIPEKVVEEKPKEVVEVPQEVAKKKPPRPRKIEEKPKEPEPESLEKILQKKLKRREFTQETMEEKSQQPQFAKTSEPLNPYEAELENMRRKLSKVDSNADSAESEASEREVKPEKKKVKKIKKKNTADMDAELDRLLNLEVGRTKLEEYEKVDVELAKREKPETVQVTTPFKRAEKSESIDEPEEQFVLKINKKERSETPDEIADVTFRKPKILDKQEVEAEAVVLRKVEPKEETEEVTFGMKKKSTVSEYFLFKFLNIYKCQKVTKNFKKYNFTLNKTRTN